MFSRRVVSVIVAVAPVLLIWQGTASAENGVAHSSGISYTRSSDLGLTEPGTGTGLTIRNVRRDGPFTAAPYYGLRFTHFFDKHPGWGLAFDFRHHKMYSQTERLLPVSGIGSGMAGNANARMDGYVENFGMSQGVSIVSLNSIYRWSDPSFSGGRLQPYVGAGLAYYLPYPGNAFDHVSNQASYDSSGFGFQLQGGVQYRLSRQWGLFAGAKINSGSARIDITGNRGETSLTTFRVVGGAHYDF